MLRPKYFWSFILVGALVVAGASCGPSAPPPPPAATPAQNPVPPPPPPPNDDDRPPIVVTNGSVKIEIQEDQDGSGRGAFKCDSATMKCAHDNSKNNSTFNVAISGAYGNLDTDCTADSKKPFFKKKVGTLVVTYTRPLAKNSFSVAFNGYGVEFSFKDKTKAPNDYTLKIMDGVVPWVLETATTDNDKTCTFKANQTPQIAIFQKK